MSERKRVMDYDSLPEGAIVLEPFKKYAPAIIGVCLKSLSVCYSVEILIEIVIKSECLGLTMDKEDEIDIAREHVEFNIINTCAGSRAPLFIESVY